MLKAANQKLAKLYPGDPAGRQPVHTFIVGADLFTPDSAQRAGAQALEALRQHAPSAAAFAKAIGLSPHDDVARRVHERVIAKLQREPVEDLRIDFEDGYGARADAEEDGHAVAAAHAVAAGMKSGTLPPFIGIRIKPLSAELHARSLRTLEIFITTLVKAAQRLPDHFAITCTKVMSPAHVAAVDRACSKLERGLKIKPKTIRLEVMIETPQSVIAADGTVAIRSLVDAGNGRVRGALLGVYDYTALAGITAAWQHPRHQACDFARHMMQVSLAQTGVMLADGGSNVFPVPPVVEHAWQTHFADVTHALVNGFYQGWDLHPAQLPTRYAAVYAFYLSSLPKAIHRLTTFFGKAEKAGSAFDDAATGQALVNFFNRALSCGAITLAEAEQTGLIASEFDGRSFRQILAARSKG